jgi:hypothetical protein
MKSGVGRGALSMYLMIYHGRKSSRRTGKLVLTYAINMLLSSSTVSYVIGDVQSRKSCV